MGLLKGKYKEAEITFKKLLKRKPKDIRLKENLFLVMLYSGKTKKALKELMLLRSRNHSPFISLYIAWAHALLGNHKKSVKYLKEAITIDTELVIDYNMDILQEKAFQRIKNFPEVKLVIHRRFNPGQRLRG